MSVRIEELDKWFQIELRDAVKAENEAKNSESVEERIALHVLALGRQNAICNLRDRIESGTGLRMSIIESPKPSETTSQEP